MTRDYAKANETIDRALAIDPKSFSLLEMKCMFAIQEKGDFTPAELALAKTNGCLPITLGPIILRVETAAIYCLSVLSYELM